MRKEARYDGCELRQDAGGKTPEGYLKGIARVTRTGVFPYRNEAGFVIMELRHPEDVFARESMDTLKLLPIQVEHKELLKVDNIKRLKVGNLGNTPQVDAPYIECDYVVDAEDGIKAVEVEGRKELSCGYVCNLIEESGTFDGIAYTHRQKDIRYNHLAITTKARLDPALRLDSDTPFAVREDGPPPPEKEPLMKKVKVDSGLEYDAAPEVAVYVDSLKAQLDKKDAEFELFKKKKGEEEEETKKDKAKKDADLDQAKAENAKKDKELKELKDSFDEKVRKYAQDRADLKETAALVMDSAELEKLDAMDSAAAKKAIILAYDSEAKLDGKSADYIDARYDSVVATVKKDGTPALAAARAASNPNPSKAKAKADAEDPREKMRNKRLDAWQDPTSNGKKED